MMRQSERPFPDDIALSGKGFSLKGAARPAPRLAAGERISLFCPPADLPGFRLLPSAPPPPPDVAESPAAPQPSPAPPPADLWDRLGEINLPEAVLRRNGLFYGTQQHPLARSFDMLRSRILFALERHGWRRIIVTAPGAGCGTTLVAANLALAFGRLPEFRALLLDLDLAKPDLARRFGLVRVPKLSEFLLGRLPTEAVIFRAGPCLALGLSGLRADPGQAPLHDRAFGATMARIRQELRPDLMLYDTPPVLLGDEVLTLIPEADAVLLVTDGTRSSPQEILEAERLLEGRLPLLGVVLNRAQDRHPRHAALRHWRQR